MHVQPPGVNMMMDNLPNPGYPQMMQNPNNHQQPQPNGLQPMVISSNGHMSHHNYHPNPGAPTLVTTGPPINTPNNGTMQPVQVIYPPVSSPGGPIAVSPMPIAGFINTSPTMPMHVITAAPPWVASPPMVSPISAMSTDSIREEQLSYLNHLLSPGSSGVPGYMQSPMVAGSSPMLAYGPGPLLPSYGMINQSIWDANGNNNRQPQNVKPQHGGQRVAQPPQNTNDTGSANTESNDGKPNKTTSNANNVASNNDINSIITSSPEQRSHSNPSTFNSDVVMTSAAARNNKIATKSGPSSRALSNRTRKFLNLEAKKESPVDDDNIDG